MGQRHTPVRPLGILAGLGMGSVVWLLSGEPRLSVAMAVLLVSPSSERSQLSLVLWIAGGSVTLGVAGWLGMTITGGPVMGGVAAGLAVGGGLGAVVRLFAFSSPGSQAETLTVEMDDAGTPTEPADLFVANPDPVLYYDGGDTPTVRAVNPAFEEAFGISEATVENEALSDALMTSETAAITAAARDGTQLDDVVDCERPAGDQPYRVRVVPVGDPSQSSGYVLYTAREDADIEE